MVLHTSTPSFASDVKTVEALKAANPSLKVGMIGAKVAVEPDARLAASAAIDFVARNEFDFTIKDVAEGRDLAEHRRAVLAQCRTASSSTTRTAPILENMDALPFVTPVYKRDLVDRELLHRLSEAPLYLVLHRPRLQDRAAPSACGRRPSAATATAPAASAT